MITLPPERLVGQVIRMSVIKTEGLAVRSIVPLTDYFIYAGTGDASISPALAPIPAIQGYY